jgi:hypothetical protein
VFCTILLARTDIARATSLVGESEAASWALALATDVGISDVGGVDDLSASSAAASVVAFFLSSVDFSASLLDLWFAYRRQWRELCLVYLFSAIGAPAVELAPAAVTLVPVAACDGPAKHTQSPATSINAERPLPLIFIWLIFILAISPFASPKSEMRPHGVSTARQKKGIFRESGQKLGNRIVPARYCEIASWRNPLKKMPRVSAGPINVISLPAPNFAARDSRAGREDGNVFRVLITTS